MREKFLKYFSVMIIGMIIMSSCSDMSEDLVNKSAPKSQTCITEAEAIQLASKWLAKKDPTTRSSSRSISNVTTLSNKSVTRSEENGSNNGEPYAYIINYDENEGFVVVATSKKVDPILAYATEGNLSPDDEVIQNNFLRKIPQYVNAAETNGFVIGPPTNPTPMIYTITPKVKCTIDQYSPWNQYVAQKYPGYNVGSLSIAATTLISHCLKEYDYGNLHFDMQMIISVLNNLKDDDPRVPFPFFAKALNNTQDDQNTRPVNAVDAMSRLIFIFGEEMNNIFQRNINSK